MSGDTTLVAVDDGGVAPLEGAGVASSWADVATALGEQDGLQTAFALTGAGLDTLGAIADPFDAFLTSAIGWAIEHVTFLREPLDALAGDPEQVVAQAQTWANVAAELRSIAAEQGAADVHGWEGAAATAHRGAVDDCGRALHGVAGQADQLASLVLGTGAAVGTVRALVRDLIADFFAWVAKVVIGALATATVTVAASTAAAIATVGWEAVALARDIASRISRLLDLLSEASGTARHLVDGMRYAVTQLRAVAPFVEKQLVAVPLAAVTEAGKQFSSAELEEQSAAQ
jgi:hypothetical protein